jgi:N-carbamoylputrescine amidase
MKASVVVAAATVASRPGETALNLEKIRHQAREAAAAGAELILFPELSLTGFLPNHPTGDHAAWLAEALRGAWQHAERLDGAAVAELARISHDEQIFVAAGILENAGGVLHNTHVLAGPGRLWGHWRKMHIPLFEMPFYNGGESPAVVDTPFGRIGVNICFDAMLPESTRLLAVQGCEIALFPFAADPAPGTAAAWSDWARPVLQARCAENGLFGVACNYSGAVEFARVSQIFPGGAMMVGPGGEILREESGPLLLAEFTSERLLAARSAFEYTFRFRRPELYALLANPSR